MVDTVVEFQFPSNGKAYPKLTETDESVVRAVGVSIPFKRESGSKVTEVADILQFGPMTFQFPSNGKADQKSVSRANRRRNLVSIPFKRESTFRR